jgi:hypothetical protein
MVDEPAEIFDDMYLGLRAGAAGRNGGRRPPHPWCKSVQLFGSLGARRPKGLTVVGWQGVA